MVSLCMAAWNPRQDWLLQAVGSALGQERCNVELIVVDDGSDEPVETHLAGIDDERLRVVRVDHGGLAAARNRGIGEAGGQFVRFIDADDALERGSTARLLELAAQEEDVITYGSILVCDEQLRPLGSFDRWRPGLPLIEYVRGRFDLIDFVPTGMISPAVQGSGIRACLLGRLRGEVESMLFPRRVVEAAGEWRDLPMSVDWDFLLRALEHATVRGERSVATYYRRHGAQTTRSGDVGLQAAAAVLDRYFERHPEERGSRLERQARARVELRRAGAYAFSRHQPFAVPDRRKRFGRHVRRAAKLDAFATAGRLLAWLPWLVAQLLPERGRPVGD